MGRNGFSAPATALLLTLLAGCAGTGAESGATAESRLPTSEQESASTPAAPSEPGSTGGAGEGELCAVEFETCPLEAGTYTVAPFQPTFTFTLDDGWTNERAWPDAGGLSKGDGAFYWASGVEAGTVGSEEVEIAAGAGEFLAFLASLESIGMTVSEATDVTVDGASGQQIDVASNDVEAPGLFSLDNDQFNLVPEEKARFIVVERDGETVVFILDAFTTEAFDAWIETARPVLDSVRWTE